MRNIKRITEVMKIWNCKRALGLLKQIYRGEFIQRSPFVDRDHLTGCCRSNAVISDR